MNDYEISDYNYIASAIGNAYFSGISFEQLWSAVSLSENREQLDEAIETTILFNEITRNHCNENH